MITTDFEKVFRDFFKPLTNIAFSVVKDEDTAKDIVQQVFIKLWDKKDSLEIRTNIKSYLHRAVVNTAINHLEKNKKIQLESEFSRFDSAIDKFEEADEKSLQLEDEVKTAIDALPPKCKIVFSLSRFSSMTNKEIAEHLDISIKSVEKHIGKALKDLRIKLKPFLDAGLVIILLNLLLDR